MTQTAFDFAPTNTGHALPESLRFDGDTYEPAEDKARLGTELQRVRSVMQDGRWHTLSSISHETGGSEAGVSARLRDLRKVRFGGHTVERKRVDGGLFAYRLIVNEVTL